MPMDTMEESVDDLMLMLMKDDETKFNHGYRDGTVQELRRNTMFMRMMGVARAAERAANLVMSIVEENEERMQMDDDHHLLITGTLAIYRVDIGSFLTKFVNPFDYNSFDECGVGNAAHGLPRLLKHFVSQIKDSRVVGNVGHVDHGELNRALNLNRHTRSRRASSMNPCFTRRSLTLALILGWPVGRSGPIV